MVDFLTYKLILSFGSTYSINQISNSLKISSALCSLIAVLLYVYSIINIDKFINNLNLVAFSLCAIPIILILFSALLYSIENKFKEVIHIFAFNKTE